MLVLERDCLRGGGTRADLVDHALEVGEFRPAVLAQNVRHQPRPAPDVHVDD